MLKALAGTSWEKKRRLCWQHSKPSNAPLSTMMLPFDRPSSATPNGRNYRSIKTLHSEPRPKCLLMSNIDHLHSEIQILPVKTHTLMLAEQYLLSGHLSNQPNVNLVNEPLAKRCTYTKFYLFPKSPKTHPHRCTHLHLLLTLNITVLIVFSHCWRCINQLWSKSRPRWLPTSTSGPRRKGSTKMHTL